MTPWIKSFHFGRSEVLLASSAGIVIVGTMLWKNWGLILAKQLNAMTEKFNVVAKSEKSILFQRLNDSAKKAGPKALKVLEIGGGTGANFEFITEPITWYVRVQEIYS